MSDTTLPIWLEPTTLQRWPAEEYASAELRVHLHIPAGWQAEEVLAEGPFGTLESSWRGASAADHLAVACMSDADPHASLRNWAETQVALVGHPVLGALTDGQLGELLVWESPQFSAQLAQHLDVDEAHVFLATTELTVDDQPMLARTWILVARRATVAWRIVLSLNTALLPDAESAMIDSNDHRRAAVVLGELRLGTEDFTP